MPGSSTAHRVSPERAEECKSLAKDWSDRLTKFADEMDRRADNYAIAAAVLSTITSLAVWSTLAGSTKWPAVLLVSLVSLASAIVAVIPKIRGWADSAKTARCLAPRLGHVYGNLRDALSNKDTESAYDAVADFEDINKELKLLKYFASVERFQPA